MAEGRQRDEWSRTAWLCAVVASLLGAEKADPAKFNPFEMAREGGGGSRKEPVELTIGSKGLRQVFAERKMPSHGVRPK